MLGDRRTAFDPVSSVDVTDPVHVFHDSVMNVATNHAVRTVLTGFVGNDALELDIDMPAVPQLMRPRRSV